MKILWSCYLLAGCGLCITQPFLCVCCNYVDWWGKDLTNICSLLGYKVLPVYTCQEIAIQSFCSTASMSATRVDLVTLNSAHPDQWSKPIFSLLCHQRLKLFRCCSPNRPSHSHEGIVPRFYCCVQAPNYIIMSCNTTMNNPTHYD